MLAMQRRCGELARAKHSTRREYCWSRCGWICASASSPQLIMFLLLRYIRVRSPRRVFQVEDFVARTIWCLQPRSSSGNNWNGGTITCLSKRTDVNFGISMRMPYLPTEMANLPIFLLPGKVSGNRSQVCCHLLYSNQANVITKIIAGVLPGVIVGCFQT